MSPDAFYRAGGKLGLTLPMRTVPLSRTLAGVGRTGGKLGLTLPTRTVPLSTTPAGIGRTGGKLGLTLPMRTVPLSATPAGVGRIIPLSRVSRAGASSTTCADWMVFTIASCCSSHPIGGDTIRGRHRFDRRVKATGFLMYMKSIDPHGLKREIRESKPGNRNLGLCGHKDFR